MLTLFLLCPHQTAIASGSKKGNSFSLLLHVHSISSGCMFSGSVSRAYSGIATAECFLSLERKEFGIHATVHLIMALSTSSTGLHCMLFMSATYFEASGIGGPPILLLFCKTDLSWNFCERTKSFATTTVPSMNSYFSFPISLLVSGPSSREEPRMK